MQFLVGLFWGGNRLRNFLANQFAVALPQEMHRHLECSFAHRQCRGDVSIASLALLTGKKALDFTEVLCDDAWDELENVAPESRAAAAVLACAPRSCSPRGRSITPELSLYCDDQQVNTRQRLDLFLDVLAAVQHAHQKGIIHRDLKPSNILVSAHNGRPVVKVIDQSD